MLNKDTKKQINSSERFSQDLWLLYAVNEDFKKDINNIKNEINNLNSLSGDEYELLVISGEIIEDFSIEQLIKEKSNKLREKYNLSYDYQSYLEEFFEPEFSECLCFDNHGWVLPQPLTPLAVQNPHNKKEYLTVLNITPETNLKEVQKYWQEIKSYAGMYWKKRKRKHKSYPRQQLSRDLEIYNLKKDGLSSSEIAKIINKKSDKTISYQEVNIIIKRLKDQADSIITR